MKRRRKYPSIISSPFAKQRNVATVQFPSFPKQLLDWSKLKAFPDDKINATEKLKFVLVRVENFVGKGENAGYNALKRLLFPGH